MTRVKAHKTLTLFGVLTALLAFGLFVIPLLRDGTVNVGGGFIFMVLWFLFFGGLWAVSNLPKMLSK